MRQPFLLDENILFHAIRGVDRHNNPDDTAARLICTIVQVCFVIVIHEVVRVRYLRKLNELIRERSPFLAPTYVFNQLLKRSDKRVFQYDELPSLPEGTTVPRKDVFLVQAALISRPIIVTADDKLRDAIRNQPSLGLTALSPQEALEFMRENQGTNDPVG